VLASQLCNTESPSGFILKRETDRKIYSHDDTMFTRSFMFESTKYLGRKGSCMFSNVNLHLYSLIIKKIVQMYFFLSYNNARNLINDLKSTNELMLLFWVS